MDRRNIIATVEVENPEWESSSFINCLSGAQKWKDFLKMPQSITIHLSATNKDDSFTNFKNRFISSSKSHLSSIYQKCKSKFISDKNLTEDAKRDVEETQLEILLKRLQNLEDYIKNFQPSKETILLVPPIDQNEVSEKSTCGKVPAFSTKRNSSKLFTIKENQCEEIQRAASDIQLINRNVCNQYHSPIKIKNNIGRNYRSHLEKPKIMNICPACRKEYIISFDDCIQAMDRGLNYIKKSNLCPACTYEKPCKLGSFEIGTETNTISCGRDSKLPEKELQNILPEKTWCVNYLGDTSATNMNDQEGIQSERDNLNETGYIRKDSFRESVKPANNLNEYEESQYRRSPNQYDVRNEVYKRYSQNDSPGESLNPKRTNGGQYINKQNNLDQDADSIFQNIKRPSVSNNVIKTRPISAVQETETEIQYFTTQNNNPKMSQRSSTRSQTENEFYYPDAPCVRSINNRPRRESIRYDATSNTDEANVSRNGYAKNTQKGNRFSQTIDTVNNNRFGGEPMTYDGVQDMEKENTRFRRTQLENGDFNQTRESVMKNDNRSYNVFNNSSSVNNGQQIGEYNQRAEANRQTVNEVQNIADNNGYNNFSDEDQKNQNQNAEPRVRSEPSNYNRYSETVTRPVKPVSQYCVRNNEFLNIEKQFSLSVPQKRVVICEYGKCSKSPRETQFVQCNLQGQGNYDLCMCTDDPVTDGDRNEVPSIAVQRVNADQKRESPINNVPEDKDCHMQCDENELQVAKLSSQLEKQAGDIYDLKKMVETCMKQMEEIKSEERPETEDVKEEPNQDIPPPAVKASPTEKYIFKTSVISLKQDKGLDPLKDEPCACCTCDVEKRIIQETVRAKDCGKCICDCKCCEERKNIAKKKHHSGTS